MNIFHVSIEVVLLSRAVRAMWALERLQAPVHKHVSVKAILALGAVEDLGTHGTGQHSRRHTLRTFLRSLPCRYW